jgi:stage V sporulation protein G
VQITEVRIKLMEDSEDRLRAFCSITIDHSFVVRDLKIIEGSSGPFVAMPSRKLTARCHRCGHKNYLRMSFCNHCGTRLRNGQEIRDEESSSGKIYADIAHPINQTCRDLIQKAVIEEYKLELERAKEPGYRSRYDEAYQDVPDVRSSDAATAIKLGPKLESGSNPDSKGSTVSHPHSSGPRRPHILDQTGGGGSAFAAENHSSPQPGSGNQHPE